MQNDNFENKKIAILGLGIEGIALAKYLRNKCKNITLLDQKDENGLLSSDEQNGIKKLLKDTKYKKILGQNYKNDLQSYDIIFRSPGIPYLDQKIQDAQKAGVQISSQVKLFFHLCPCPIIGVTGTKGKGTTASLIFEILRKKSQTLNPPSTTLSFESEPEGSSLRVEDGAGKSQTNSNPPAGGQNSNEQKNIYLAGNIGKPAISFVDDLSGDDIVILELSSFQLQDLDMSPHIAVITNLSSDHLDYHKDTSEYQNAKESIVKYQKTSDYAIINQDYLTAFELSAGTAGKIYYFSGKNSVDAGAYIKKLQITNNKLQTNHKSQITNLQTHEVVLKMDDKEEVVCRSDEIKLVGRHNLENIAAAAIAAHVAGASIDEIRDGAKSFIPLPHRLEFVDEIKGIKFYNDSYATSPDPTMAAIDSFSEDKVLILGGSNKGADFNILANKISIKNVSGVVLIGDESEKIQSALITSGYSGKVVRANRNLELAVSESLEIAKAGNIVIFSPACASFDMFKNYKDRGNKFKETVLKYK